MTWGGIRGTNDVRPRYDKGKASAHEAWLDFKEWHKYGIVPSTGLDDLFVRVRQVLARYADEVDED